MVAGGVLPHLLSALVVTTPPKIMTESLRILTMIVTELQDDIIEDYTGVYDQVVYQIRHSVAFVAFARIISEEFQNRYSETQFTLVLQILQALSRDNPKIQSTLVSTGILDLLASKLAAWIITNQPEFRSNENESLAQIRPPPKSSYADIARLIALIVQGSRYRCARLYYSNDIVAIFPKVPKFLSDSTLASEPFGSLSPRSWDQYLPKITPPPFKPDFSARSFPALMYETARVPFVDSATPTFGTGSSTDDANSDFLAWLVTMSRHVEGYTRICTLYLFSTLIQHSDLNKRFERPLAFLVIPILIKMTSDGTWPEPGSIERCAPELFPESILATIVLGSPWLQLATFEANAIKELCVKLKKLFEPVSDPPKTMWTPFADNRVRKHSLKDTNLLGPPVLSQRLSDIFYRRASILSALSALTEKEDPPRKEIMKHGIVHLIVESLTPYPDRMISKDFYSSVGNADPKEGNPNRVLIAALDLVRAMARSVHTLRTSLIDGSAAKPVFGLMRHNVLEVRVRATNTATNLVMKFSPMREVFKSNVQCLDLTLAGSHQMGSH
jgi:hypothetical protein